MPFCWVWWYCVPRLKTDFVPCVQKGATPCQPVPNPFGGSFGGKLVRRILTRTVQINAQFWSHREMWIPTSRGSYEWKAPRTSNEVLLSIQKLYASATPQHPRTPPLSPREMPLFGHVRTASARYSPSQIAPQTPRFPGIFILPQRHLPRLDFPVQVNPAQINTK